MTSLASEMNDDFYLCYKSSTTLLYRNDKNTGRCRLSNDLFDKYNIRIGWIVKLLIIIDNVEFNILCSAWPLCQLQDTNQVYIDDTVFITSNIESKSTWINSKCKILKAFKTRICSSLHIQPVNNKIELLHHSKFIGLPTYSNCIINIGENKYTIISSNPTDQVSMISTDTIIRFSTYKEKSLDNNHMNASTTSLVDDIIKYTVIPTLIPYNFSMQTKGILLLGPPGVGKTFAVKAVQSLCLDFCCISIVNLSIPDILSDDQPIEALKELLKIPIENSNSIRKEGSSNSKKLNKNLSRLTFFMIDEIDALGSPKSQSDIQAAIKQHICYYFDQRVDGKSNWCMIATSNRSQDVDPCFRRGGRFEKEIEVMGNRDDRYRLIKMLLRAYQQKPDNCIKFNEKDLDLLSNKITDVTSGFVAADLKLLVNESWSIYVTSIKSISIPGELNYTKFFMDAIEKSMKIIVPSSLRGMITKLPSIKLEDVIGYDNIKASLKQLLSFYSSNMREKVLRFGLKSPGGALLYGPPGNAKTRLVMATAAHHKLPVISLSAADVYSPYVGDAEAEIRKAFRIARQASPCVLFVDELDALVTNRGISDSNSDVESRVLATFLTEMDGIDGKGNGVIVIGATNRLESIDAAMIRKGRFYQVLHVPPPSLEDQNKILQFFANKSSLPHENIEALIKCLRVGMSGAEIENLCKESALKIMNQIINTEQTR